MYCCLRERIRFTRVDLRWLLVHTLNISIHWVAHRRLCTSLIPCSSEEGVRFTELAGSCYSPRSPTTDSTMHNNPAMPHPRSEPGSFWVIITISLTRCRVLVLIFSEGAHLLMQFLCYCTRSISYFISAVTKIRRTFGGSFPQTHNACDLAVFLAAPTWIRAGRFINGPVK